LCNRSLLLLPHGSFPQVVEYLQHFRLLCHLCPLLSILRCLSVCILSNILSLHLFPAIFTYLPLFSYPQRTWLHDLVSGISPFVSPLSYQPLLFPTPTSLFHTLVPPLVYRVPMLRGLQNSIRITPLPPFYLPILSSWRHCPIPSRYQLLFFCSVAGLHLYLLILLFVLPPDVLGSPNPVSTDVDRHCPQIAPFSFLDFLLFVSFREILSFSLFFSLCIFPFSFPFHHCKCTTRWWLTSLFLSLTFCHAMILTLFPIRNTFPMSTLQSTYQWDRIWPLKLKNSPKSHWTRTIPSNCFSYP